MSENDEKQKVKEFLEGIKPPDPQRIYENSEKSRDKKKNGKKGKEE